MSAFFSLLSFLLFTFGRISLRLAHNNSISHIPLTLSGWVSQLQFFTTGGNPSECYRVLDIPSGNTTGVCDCAKGFYGVHYCEPIDTFFRLPAYITSRGGNVLRDSRLVGGLQVLESTNGAEYTLQISSPRVDRVVTIPSELTAFGVDSEGVPDPPQAVARLTSLRQPSADLVTVRTNDGAPTSLSYTSSSLISGLDLIPTSSGFRMSLTPSTSGIFSFNVTATDSFCGESKIVAVVSLVVRDCGNRTCFNGGTCVDLGSSSTDGDFLCLCTASFKGALCNDSKTDCERQPCANGGVCEDTSESLFDNDFTCSCASGFQGALCDVAVAKSAAASSSLDTTALAGIGVGAVVVLLALAVVLVAVWIRRRNKARKRKDYHVFISYRVDSDADVAETLCRQLQEKFVEEDMRVKCFFDKQDIRDGVDWKNAFLTALEHTCLFVPLISEASIDRFKALTPESKPDNVLLEYEEAIRLHSEKRLAVFPIFIGKRQYEGSAAAKFDWAEFGSHRFPKTLSPTKKTGSIADTMTHIFGFQGVLLESIEGMRVYHRSSDDHASAAVAERVLLTLLDVAWNSGKPDSIPGKAQWSKKKKKKPATRMQRKGRANRKVGPQDSEEMLSALDKTFAVNRTFAIEPLRGEENEMP
jgi:hypothetical protein